MNETDSKEAISSPEVKEVKEEDKSAEKTQESPLIAEVNKLNQMCYDLKREGDEALKANNYDEAYKCYTKAVVTVKELFKENKQPQEELTRLVHEVLVTSNSNMCVLDIKKQDWANCLRHANKVIHYDQSNVKGRYRRCLAYINLGKYEKADEDLFELEDAIGGTPELEQLEKMFESKKLKNENEEGMIYKRMSKKLRNPEVTPKREQTLSTNSIKNNGIMSSIQSFYSNCLRYVCSRCRKNKQKVN